MTYQVCLHVCVCVLVRGWTPQRAFCRAPLQLRGWKFQHVGTSTGLKFVCFLSLGMCILGYSLEDNFKNFPVLGTRVEHFS